MLYRRSPKPSAALDSERGVGAEGGEQDGVGEAKALHEASKKFAVTTEVLLDIAETGKIDDPENWKAAKQFHEALGAALV